MFKTALIPVVQTDPMHPGPVLQLPPEHWKLLGDALVERQAGPKRHGGSRATFGGSPTRESSFSGLSVTFVGLAFVGAIVIRIADPDNFPSLGLGIWWALQTVTTVGYGDVVPTTAVGRAWGCHAAQVFEAVV